MQEQQHLLRDWACDLEVNIADVDSLVSYDSQS